MTRLDLSYENAIFNRLTAPTSSSSVLNSHNKIGRIDGVACVFSFGAVFANVFFA